MNKPPIWSKNEKLCRDDCFSRHLENAELTSRLVFAIPNLHSFCVDSVERHGDYEAMFLVKNEIESLLPKQPELTCKHVELSDLSQYI